MTIKVLMKPHPDELRGPHESGIKRVVENYAKYLPHFDVELVHPNATTYDIKASHAGEGGTDAEVLMCHGLYWADDNRQLSGAELRAIMHIVSAVRQAKEITVPSNWVAETFQRDMKIKATKVIYSGTKTVATLMYATQPHLRIWHHCFQLINSSVRLRQMVLSYRI